ncbi:response regulator [Sulfurimonas aquatica]|uniref:Response regulator n=1 Tax=Sulfurimonas aquatica TaxID=2672570 RepID=A0A975AYD6_9BACT|nr:response regulator transcription factor [Sulfurimonas aquatica]QSZ40755.1 response regulator [Sulfurimonas aquatica]
MNILLMEDDAVLSDILLDYLRESWSVDYAFNSDEVYKCLESKKYDLFIFDINVTGKNGLELLAELREFCNHTPTIFITAYTDTNYLKKAFTLGAHDYIKKPFELEELNARIENTKRLFNIGTRDEVQLSPSITFIPLTKEILSNGVKISLGTKNSMLLSYFLNNKKRLITTEELAQNIWDFDSLPSDATLRSHIRTLRELIGKDSITTVRGQGYIYE